MIIKKIWLENIRSYESAEVEFPEGSTLLWGDIGSGKTSILLGIEFALFGLQPGQRGNALLRNTEKQGGVKIQIEIDGKEVIIERTLKRKKTVSQDYCAITINGEKKETSVTELKNTVLNLLNYPGEFAKKQNLLYKFTVYTPQEEMKQIILEDPKTRINTLRHIFGIDKYKRILENTSILTSKLREEKRRKEGQVDSLEADKKNLEDKQKQVEEKKVSLVNLKKELEEKEKLRKKADEDKKAIEEKIEEKNKLKQEVEKTKIMVYNKKESINNNKKTAQQILEQIEELKKLEFDETKLENLEKEIESFRKKINILNEEKLSISSKVSSLELKNNDNEKIKEKLTHIEVCPTCLQDVNEQYKSNVKNKLSKNTEENKEQIQELNQQKEEITKNIGEIESQIREKEKEISDLKMTKIKLEGINDKQKHLEEVEKNNLSLQKDIVLLESQIEVLTKSVFELQKYDKIYEEKQKRLELAFDEEKRAEIKVAELTREIKVFLETIEELKEKIQKTQEIKKQLEYLGKLEHWLTNNFIPLISYIEKNVMVKLKAEFSELFARWFSMLVSDTFNVRLDDDFSPIIEQQDYEIDYSYLSGGERTAVALAYRLALNQEINSFLSKIKTKDIVILDEPTDGFSDQQLDKMRDVLQQLNAKQLILVSHEQKIEGFVENVVKFKKENGLSQIIENQ